MPPRRAASGGRGGGAGGGDDRGKPHGPGQGMLGVGVERSPLAIAPGKGVRGYGHLRVVVPPGPLERASTDARGSGQSETPTPTGNKFRRCEHRARARPRRACLCPSLERC